MLRVRRCKTLGRTKLFILIICLYCLSYVKKQLSLPPTLQTTPLKMRLTNINSNATFRYEIVRANMSASRKEMGLTENHNFNLSRFMALNASNIDFDEAIRSLIQITHEATWKCLKTVNVGGKRYCPHNQASIYDGFKPVCLDEAVKPKPKSCIVLSFGVGYEWSFDNMIAQYGCKVFSFDFSMRNYTNFWYGEGKHFLTLMLSNKTTDKITYTIGKGETRDKKFLLNISQRTLEGILNILDLAETQIDYLKLDIEEDEWEVFLQIFSSSKRSSILRKINQIVIEIHLEFLLNMYEDRDAVVDKVYDVFEVLQNLSLEGFRMVNWMPNKQTGSAFKYSNLTMSLFQELHFIRVAG
ncbi:uncharacterized protein LOC108668402 [Hyalella azteca]|uniref:Uncharacterized protein LOC108668402 n=1 Tax=Hyalella azteca TaxID=294128 RepID=A0A8B7NBZ2_HYAAZ|nr:uncharacterized protein LOC108668402 [Hyalella azteca]